MAGAYTSAPPATEPASAEPVALGEALFRQPALACTACHATQPGVTLAGPSLAGIGQRAAETVADPRYTGSATDAAGYLRESILTPSVHLVPGANFATAPTGGVSLMPADYGTRLQEEQINHLVAYLLTFR
jgi:nitric oxide reductase subunit C